MAEQFVAGREITVGIVCGEALPLVEIVPSAEVEFYDYQAKYFRDDTKYIVNPPLPVEKAEACTQAALIAYARLGCRDVARADFIVNDEGAWFLELNTMPGFTTHSLLPMAAAANGQPLSALCAQLIDSALDRAPAGAATYR